MPLAAIAGLVGKGLDAFISNKTAKQNIKFQKQFAQQGIQWKVADAQAAGLHPLAALGAQTHSFSPVQVGSNFGEIGQDISRAMQAKQTETGRLTNEQKQIHSLAVERGVLENQLLASQVAKANQPAQPPAMPSPGEQWLLPGQAGPGAGMIKTDPMERQASDPYIPAQEAGVVSDRGYVRTGPDSFAVVPSRDAKERLEDMGIPSFQWTLRNMLMPQPPYAAPAGKRWTWNPLTGTMRLVQRGARPGYVPRRDRGNRPPAHQTLRGR